MIAIVFVVLAVGFVAAYLLNSWATAHALAVLIGDQWSIQAHGWGGLWPVLAVGMLAGAVMGVALGVGLSGKLAEVLAERQSSSADQAQKALQAQRQELAKRQAGIDAEIKKVADERIKSIKEWGEKIAIENEKNKDEILRLQRKTGIIEGRMKGAQQKAARLKKARLMSV